MRIRRIGSSCALFPSWYTWANPIVENDELREDFDRDYNVKPTEGSYGIRLLPDPAGERGRKIHIIA